MISLRTEALNQALRMYAASPGSNNTDAVIKTAEKFFIFLKGSKEEETTK